MIVLPLGAHVWLACGYTDMRKGMDGLAMLAQQVLTEDPFICVERGYVAAQFGEPAIPRRRRTSPPHNISSFLPWARDLPGAPTRRKCCVGSLFQIPWCAEATS